MDNREAKKILWLYRPGVDDTDQQFAEELTYANQHPEVRQWLDEQCATYQAIRTKVKEIPIPPGLPRQILGERVFERPVAWWRSRIALGAAAVIIIGLSALSVVHQIVQMRERPIPQRANFAAFRNEMVYFATSGYGFDVNSTSFDELRQQFARKGWPSDYVVPPHIAALTIRGGCLAKWNEHKVAMLCLKGANDHRVWLYVIPCSLLPDPPPAAAPTIIAQDNVSTASWSQGDEAYLLAAEGDETFLRTLL